MSEYGHGRYAWVLSMMFVFGAICVWSLAFAIRSEIQTTGGTIGWALLVATGLGTAFASIFDIDHPLHELCGMVGILGLTAAAVLLSISLGRTQPWSQMRGALLWSANLTWISVVVFAITMAIFIVTYTRTGASTTTPIPVGAPLPDGVIGINGWTNRVLLIPFWALTVAWCALRLSSELTVRDVEEAVQEILVLACRKIGSLRCATTSNRCLTFSDDDDVSAYNGVWRRRNEYGRTGGRVQSCDIRLECAFRRIDLGRLVLGGGRRRHLVGQVGWIYLPCRRARGSRKRACG